MALSEKSRATMYTYFAATDLGEEATSDMLSNFPSLEFDTLVTKDFLRAELNALRGELRDELHSEIGGLRTEVHSELRRMTTWLIATMITLNGLTSGLLLAVH